MKVTRIEIKNYRGIRDMSFDVPPAGVMIAGDNALGKSSVLRAITAALAAQDVGPDAIHHGADKAEILVELDELGCVRRRISAKTTSLEVSTADGLAYKAPQTKLNEKLGTSAVDPMAMFMAKKADERRKIILEATPVKVTADDLKRWTGDKFQLPAMDLGRHGLEVVAELAQAFYDRRRDVNKDAKAANAKADAAKVEAARLAPALNDALEPNLESAKVREAEDALAELYALQSRAQDQEEKSIGTRERIAKLRADAEAQDVASRGSPSESDLAAAEDAFQKACEKVDRLKAELRAAEDERNAADTTVERISDAIASCAEHKRKAAERTAQAVDLEASLAAVSVMAPVESDIQAAKAVVAEASRSFAAAKASDAARVAIQAAELASKEAADVQARADELDAVVTALTKTAPAELVARSCGIPGLGFAEDGEVMLDGVSFTGISGSERMRFCVDVARRANAKSKIVLVDATECIAESRQPEFVRMVTAGGFQLFATCVRDGELVVEALEEDEAPEIAGPAPAKPVARRRIKLEGFPDATPEPEKK